MGTWNADATAADSAADEPVEPAKNRLVPTQHTPSDPRTLHNTRCHVSTIGSIAPTALSISPAIISIGIAIMSGSLMSLMASSGRLDRLLGSKIAVDSVTPSSSEYANGMPTSMLTRAITISVTTMLIRLLLGYCRLRILLPGA